MSASCLSKEEKRVTHTAFKRYHAALQVDNDARIVWLGAVIYALALRPVLAQPAPIGGPFVAFQVFLLAISTLWPFALRLWSYETLLRWRDEFFIVHWILHHLIGPRVLNNAGVNFRTNLVSSTPLFFFLGFLFTRPTMWYCGNMVTYRMKFYLFAIVQPIIIVLQWPEEQKACRASATEYPELTSTAFGNFATVFRGVTRSWSQTTPLDDAMSICCKVHAFVVVMVALVLPGAVIWYLERQTWRDFTRLDPALLTWEEGPDPEQIAFIQKKMRKEYKRRADFGAGFDGRIFAIAFVIAATLWQLLDAPISAAWLVTPSTII